MSNNSNSTLYYQKKMKSYVLGFVLSIILTVLPFSIIMTKIFSSRMNYITIIICAIIQIFIHFICFLDLDFTVEKYWHIISLLFVMIIVFIVAFGSIWIMSNLNHHMLVY